MSGGNSKGGGRSGNSSVGGGGSGGAKRGGWEEAGGEFYQESYPGGGGGSENIATLLPSKHHRKNLSNEESTWEEIMQIKAMPVPMGQKRELKAQLQSATKLRLQGFEQLKWRRRKAWQGTKARIKEALDKLELWKYSFKTIEGNFGTGVVAYFLLLKWLLFLNLAISTLIFFFIFLPSIILQKNVEAESCEGNLSNSTQCCSEFYEMNTSNSTDFLQIIQGSGWMEQTYIYYGMYPYKEFTYYVGGRDSNATFLQDNTGTPMYYNLPLVYIMIPIVYFLISLMAIVKAAAKGFKERLVEGEGQFYQYCNLIFGGWDFCIHNEKSANIKHKALYNEMKGCLEEERMEEERQSRSREEQIKLITVRILINTLIICILCAAGSAIYFAFDYSVTELDSNTPDNHSSMIPYQNMIYTDLVSVYNNTSDSVYRITELDFKPDLMHPTTSAFSMKNAIPDDTLSQMRIFLLEYFPSLCIVCLNIIVPIMFQYLIGYENYSPAFVIKLTLIRTVFLRLSSLAVLIYQLYQLIDGQKDRDCADQKLMCWETYVGQQFYKLLMTDFFIQFIMTFIVNFPRSLIARHTESKFVRMLGEQEFHLPKHVLDVVYSQTLCWLGAFYCPVLPLIATVFCFLMFYIKKFACLVNSKPSSTVYRASRSNSLFMIVLLISFCVAIIPVSFAIAEISPSKSCGPFRDMDTVWTKMIKTFESFPKFFKDIFFLMGTSVFAIPAFIVLILLLYYYWAVTDANRHMVSVLKSQLVLEGHDKQFLLNRLSAFIRQQQKRNEKVKQHHVHTNIEDEDSIRHSSR